MMNGRFAEGFAGSTLFHACACDTISPRDEESKAERTACTETVCP